MRLLAICGSLQQRSSNLTLLHRAAALSPADVEFVLYDGLGTIPPFDPDVEARGFPAAVADFKEKIAAADGILIACPEYAHGVPGSVKNALDWLVGSMELDKLPIAVTASVPHPERGRMALQSLSHTLTVMGAVTIGGDPITRGQAADDELHALLAELIEVATARVGLANPEKRSTVGG